MSSACLVLQFDKTTGHARRLDYISPRTWARGPGRRTLAATHATSPAALVRGSLLSHFHNSGSRLSSSKKS